MAKATRVSTLMTGSALALALSACGPAPIELSGLGYTAPERRPAMPMVGTLAESPGGLQALPASLGGPGDGSGSSVEGVRVTTYSGDPRPYVDCGVIANRGTSFEAAGSQALLDGVAEGRPWQALRQMRLDARAVAEVEPEGQGSRYAVTASYVVTRTTDTLGAEGAVIGSRRDLISFESGGRGRFDNGTTCVPTGELERRVLAALTGEELVASAEGPAPAVPPPAAAGTATAATGPRDLLDGPSPPAAAAPPLPSAGIATAALPPLDGAPQAPDAPASSQNAAPAAAPPVAPPQEEAPGLVELAYLEPPEGAERVSLPCAEMLLQEQGGRVRAFGFVGTATERDRLLAGIAEQTGGGRVEDRLLLLPQGGCELLTTARRALDRQAGTSLQVGLDGGPRPLEPGEEVMLDVTLRGADKHFHVVHVEPDGTVEHLGPRFIDGSAVGERFLYKTGYTVEGSAGVEMALVLASTSQLFDEPLPPSEPLDEFLSRLSERLDRGPDDVLARVLVVDTEA